jgi:hypothetical protein
VRVVDYLGVRSARAPREHPNRRSEDWFGLGEALQFIDQDDDTELATDLLAPRYAARLAGPSSSRVEDGAEPLGVHAPRGFESHPRRSTIRGCRAVLCPVHATESGRATRFRARSEVVTRTDVSKFSTRRITSSVRKERKGAPWNI